MVMRQVYSGVRQAYGGEAGIYGSGVLSLLETDYFDARLWHHFDARLWHHFFYFFPSCPDVSFKVASLLTVLLRHYQCC